MQPKSPESVPAHQNGRSGGPESVHAHQNGRSGGPESVPVDLAIFSTAY
jgi:hypothetical protein